jgi:hypothetical protein
MYLPDNLIEIEQLPLLDQIDTLPASQYAVRPMHG